VRIDKVRASGPFVNHYSCGFQLCAESRVPANVFNHLANAFEETRIIQGRRARRNSVLAKLSSFSDKPRSMGKRSDWHWAVVGGHPAELSARHQRSTSAQVSGTKGRNQSSRAAAYYCNIGHSDTAFYLPSTNSGKMKLRPKRTVHIGVTAVDSS
jgi:hypothetical protein